LLKNAQYMAEGCRLVITVPGPMSAFDKHIGHRKHLAPPEIENADAAEGYARARERRRVSILQSLSFACDSAQHGN
jgi:hypothetical protein